MIILADYNFYFKKIVLNLN